LLHPKKQEAFQMNQTTIGKYIARKRKEQNLTQEQLAQQPGVSNKTIYKWENGKCMPDYSIIHKLCDALHVTRPELMDGEDAAEDSVRVYDDAQILDLLHRTQELKRQKGILYGVALITLGIASSAMSGTVGGTDVRDFISGILMGLSVVEILAGIGIVGKKLLKQ
jgi:transcriptional regulator with XRE-family HTH domain